MFRFLALCNLRRSPHFKMEGLNFLNDFNLLGVYSVWRLAVIVSGLHWFTVHSQTTSTLGLWKFLWQPWSLPQNVPSILIFLHESHFFTFWKTDILLCETADCTSGDVCPALQSYTSTVTLAEVLMAAWQPIPFPAFCFRAEVEGLPYTECIHLYFFLRTHPERMLSH